MDNEDERLKIDKENEYEREVKKKKSPVAVFIAVIVVIAAISGAYFGLNGGSFAVNSQSLTNVKNTVMSAFNGITGSSSSGKSAVSSVSSAFSSAASSANSKEMGISFDSSTKSVFKSAGKGFFHFSKDALLAPPWGGQFFLRLWTYNISRRFTRFLQLSLSVWGRMWYTMVLLQPSKKQEKTGCASYERWISESSRPLPRAAGGRLRI